MVLEKNLSNELVLHRLWLYNTQTNRQCMNSCKNNIHSFCLTKINKTNSCDTVMHNYYYYSGWLCLRIFKKQAGENKRGREESDPGNLI